MAKINQTYYPTCRFCGGYILPLENYKDQTEADEASTMSCDCYEAKQYQEAEKKKKERKYNIDQLAQGLDDFDAYCDKRGTQLKGDLHDLLHTTGIAVLDGLISSASIKFARLKVNINQNNKGKIVIGFTYSDGAKMEV